MGKPNPKNIDKLSKDKVLTLLSNRLNCSVESLSFLFNYPNSNDNKSTHIDIPKLRDY